MKPALTPEEWKDLALYPYPDFHYEFLFGGDPENRRSFRHAHAAVALGGQDYGFTHEDVALLRWSARDGEKQIAAAGPNEPTYEKIYRPKIIAWNSLADRIEALLPPAKVAQVGHVDVG